MFLISCGDLYVTRSNNGRTVGTSTVFVESELYEIESELDLLRARSARNDLTNPTSHAIHAPT